MDPAHPSESDTSESIATSVRRSFQAMSAAIVVTALLVLAAVVVNLIVFQPRVDASTRVIRAARNAHEAILDQETSLRGWIATGDSTFLGPYRAAAEDIDGHLSAITRSLGRLPESNALLEHAIDFRVSYQRWHEAWAVPALDLFGGDDAVAGPALRSRLAAGRELFDAYRAAEDALLTDVQDVRDGAIREQRRSMAIAGFAVALQAVAFIAFARRQSHRLERRIAEPIRDLIETMDRVADGDLRARPRRDGPEEMRILATSLGSMVKVIEHQQGELAEREAAQAVLAERLAQILQMTQEISGSGSPRYVAEAAAESACQLAEARRATIWVLHGADELSLLHDTDIPHGADVADVKVALGVGVVGKAVSDGRLVSRADPRDRGSRHAWPLVVGARVVGALQIESDEAELDTATLDAVSTLAVHTASSLEAARLYAENEQLARTDVLTRLGNRRTFNEDLALEAERAHRYGRPLSLLILDLDHFKVLNDTWGHPFGDVVLERIGQTLTAMVRTVDSAYRLGGEEFGVLARETDEQGAANLAERIREAISRCLSIEAGDPTTVTASIGVAELDRMVPDTTALSAAADAALYAAKRGGRNRVEVASAATPA